MSELEEPEVWRAIPGFQGLYDASSHGRIRSHHRGGKIKEPIRTRDGYLLTFLHSERGRVGHNVHRLVCMAFYGPPDGALEAAHLDGNRLNNLPSNLAWTTRQVNLGHKRIHDTIPRGETHPKSRLTEEQARAIWLSPLTSRELAAQLDVTQWAIDDVRSGKNWRHVTNRLPPGPTRYKGSPPKDPPASFAQDISAGFGGRRLAQKYGISRATAWRWQQKLKS